MSNTLYKVVKVYRNRPWVREVLRRHVTESQAQSIVQSYPDRRLSMVVYMKEGRQP